MKGVGRIYQQTFVDTYTRVALAKLYTEKTAIVAADLLNDKVLPFFEEYGIDLNRVLIDRGTEYSGKVESHAYELYLALEDIDHSRTKAYSPQTNGICERFHKTMLTSGYLSTMSSDLIVEDTATGKLQCRPSETRFI
jgi:transposase InsO family protein